MKKLLTALLAFTLVFAPLTTVFAEENGGYENGNGTDPVPPVVTTLPVNITSNYEDDEAGSIATAITKYLYMPCAATFPTGIEFEFEFTPVGQIFRGERYGLTGAPTAAPTVPTLGTLTGTATDATPVPDADRADLGVPEAWTVENDVCIYATEFNFADLFTNVNGWTAPGHFIFTVTEVAGTNDDALPFLPGYEELVTYDNTEFELHVVVSQLANGDLYISGIYAWNTGETEDGWTGVVTWNEDGVIVGNDLVNQAGKVEYISFLNGFRRWTEDTELTVCPLIPDPENEGEYIEDPDCDETIIEVPCPDTDPNSPYCLPSDDNPFNSALTVRKTVTGNQGDFDQLFDFRVEIERHVLDTVPATTGHPITGYVWTWDNNAWNRAATPVVFTAPNYTFQLRHNQILVFDEILIGTGVTVTETNPHGHTPSVVWTFGTDSETENGSVQGGVATDAGFISEETNEANFTNNLDSVPITGLIMNNLPIILIAVGAIGFIAMIVAGKNRRVYE